MFQLLSDTLLAAAREVNQPLPRKQLCLFQDRLVLCGLPVSASAQQQKDLHPLRSLQPFDDGPEALHQVLLRLPPLPPDPVYFVWNLSGLSWEASFCEVIEYDFPGRPIPPLLALVEISKAIAQYLNANTNHVAIVHDVSGRKSAVVVACVLVLLRGKGENMLNLVCEEMGNAGRALVASQRRYFAYFLEMQQRSSKEDGEEKAARAIVIKRIIVANGVPNYAPKGTPKGMGYCEPRFVVFDGRNRALGASQETMRVMQSEMSFSMRSADEAAGGIRVCGDGLVRVYSGDLAMFAFAFHTNFLPAAEEGGGGVLRLALHELDGTQGSSSKRFPRGMFVDVVFMQAENAVASTQPLAPKLKVNTRQEDEALLWKEIDEALGGDDVAAAADEEDLDLDEEELLNEIF